MASWISADKVIELAKFKRMIPMFGRFMLGNGEFAKKNIFKKILIATSAILYKEYLLQWLWWAWRDLYLPVNKYNQPAREMYQAIADEKVRDIVCAILEYDMAYRLRFQDIMANLNKELFFKNPRKEINRLFDILTEREHDDHKDPMSLHQRWKFIKLALNIGLIFSRKTVRQLTDVVANLDLTAIAPTEADQYWMCSPAYWGGYNFMGMDTDERKKKFKEMQ